MNEASEKFQAYAWLSVQIDQYYAAVRIFARHYDGIQCMYRAIPRGSDWPTDLNETMSESVRGFFLISSLSLQTMGETGIFDGAPFPQLANLRQDMLKFAFTTCFCFQWSIFEEFVRDSVEALAENGA